jgi:phenylalanyl-tRNA synthetase alpha chain
VVEEKIRALAERARRELEGAASPEALEGWRLAYLSRKGEVSSLMTLLREASPGERPRLGQKINRLKQDLQEEYGRREAHFEEEARSRAVSAEQVDVTLPGYPPSPGRLHLTTLTLRKISRIFFGMGFEILESPEVESDNYNFELLNMPPHHPARDMWDTFYLTESVLLRTHTSPGQIHAMLPAAPKPLRVILPGRCYRYEAVTARSEFMFYQVEGLAVGKDITLAHLKGVLETFARQMFGRERQIRLRGSYFPFTEPSVEFDMDCILCHGEGCRICKGTGWLEIGGAGMVHPVVLENGGYDPATYSGFAFGMGPERIAMLINRVDDIRYFYSNDLRFLSQHS